MKTTRLKLTCPLCGSSDIVYSCEPKCCFNHFCADCGATFEPVTRALGERLAQVAAPDPLPDASDPTAACARCDSVAVYLLEDGRAVCGICGALLAVEYTEVMASVSE